MSDEKYLTVDEYNKCEQRQTLHRRVNTALSGILVVSLLLLSKPVYDSLSELTDALSGREEQRVVASEIGQIAVDEAYRKCAYLDSRGKLTVGFGTLVEGTSMKLGDCIDPHNAVSLLRSHYTQSYNSVTTKYPWAEGEVKLVLTNLDYNLGTTGLSKFVNTLKYMEMKEYDSAASEMIDSDWCDQVKSRCTRLVGRVMTLEGNK